DRFRALEGVSVVNVGGALRRELSVLLRIEKMREYNVSAAEVIDALRLQNMVAPVGRVSGDVTEQSIRLVGRIDAPEQFDEVIVKRRGSSIVRLGQVARIADGFAEVDGYSLHNGQPNVSINVVRARDSSEVTVAHAVRQLIAEISSTLPKGTTL